MTKAKLLRSIKKIKIAKLNQTDPRVIKAINDTLRAQGAVLRQLKRNHSMRGWRDEITI